MKFLYLLILINFVLFSQEENKIIKNKELHKLLDNSNIAGKEFWLSVPPAYNKQPGDFNDYNTRFIVLSSYDTEVRCTKGTELDTTISIKAGGVGTFIFNQSQAQPYIQSIIEPMFGNPAQVYDNKGLHITSDEPIIIYVVVRYQHTTDGFLAIPTQSLGTEYVASHYDARPNDVGSLPNYSTIVATEDNTEIDFYLGGNNFTEVRTETKRVMSPLESETWQMNKGDVLVVSNLGAGQTLAGSFIKSNKPIAHLSGSYCAEIPINIKACDYIVEMDFPIHTWGRIYPIPVIGNRLRPSILRIFAKYDDTQVFRDGQEFLYLEKGVYETGGVQNSAWVETRVWGYNDDPKVALITSDKPIYVALFNPGSDDDGVESDPFSMLLNPIEQFQNEILFSTPNSKIGATFRDNFLNIIFETDSQGNIPEDLEFGEYNEDGDFQWSKLTDEFGEDLVKYIQVASGNDANIFSNSEYKNKFFAQKTLILPVEGVFGVRSTSKLNAYSYGLDYFDSYGYPTSTGLIFVKDISPCGEGTFFDTEVNFETDYDISSVENIDNKTLLFTDSADYFSHGSLTYKEQAYISAGFETEYAFKISNGVNDFEDGSLPGADGFSLIFHTDNPVYEIRAEQLGGGMGYHNKNNALAFEIDMYKNSEFSDPDGNHFAIQKKNGEKLQAIHNDDNTIAITSDILELKSDGTETYYCRIEYSNKILSVWFNNEAKFIDPILEIENIDFSNYLNLIDNSKVYVTLAAVTGNSHQKHELLYWDWCSAYDPISDVEVSERNNLRVYPNPVKDILHLDYEGQITNLQIIDLQGRTILEKQNLKSNTINISTIEKGVYFVLVNNKERYKIIKE